MTFGEWEKWRTAWLLRCPVVKAQHLEHRHTDKEMYRAVAADSGSVTHAVVMRWIEGDGNPAQEYGGEHVAAIAQYCGLSKSELVTAWDRWLAEYIDFEEARVLPTPPEAVIDYEKRQRAHWHRRVRRFKQARKREVYQWLLEHPSPLCHWRACRPLDLIAAYLNRRGYPDELQPDPSSYLGGPGYAHLVVLRAWEQGGLWHRSGGHGPWSADETLFRRLASIMQCDEGEVQTWQPPSDDVLTVPSYLEALIWEWKRWSDSHPRSVWWRKVQGISWSENAAAAAADKEVEWFKRLGH